MNILLPLIGTLLLAGAGDPECADPALRFRTHFDRAEALRAGANMGEALAAYRKAHVLVREVCGEDSDEEARILFGLGYCLPFQGKSKEASVHLRRAVEIAGKRLGPKSKRVHEYLLRLVDLLHGSRMWRESLPLAHRSVELAVIHEPAGSDARRNARFRLARTLLECAKPWAAERIYRRELLGSSAGRAWVGIGRVRASLGRLGEAEMYVRKGFDVDRTGYLLATEGWFLAEILEKRGRKSAAEALRKRISSIWRQES